MATIRILLVFSVILPCAAALRADDCTNQSRSIIIPRNGLDEKISAPACAKLVVNALHYAIGHAVDVQPYRALPVEFGTIGPPPDSLEAAFQFYENKVNEVLGVLSEQENTNRTEESEIEKSLRELNALAIQSDANLVVGGDPNDVITFAKNQGAFRNIATTTAKLNGWKSVDPLIDALRQIRVGLDSLRLDYAHGPPVPGGQPCTSSDLWSVWYSCRGAAYEDLRSAIDTRYIPEGKQWVAGSENANTFENNAALVLQWQFLIQSLKASDFDLLVQKSNMCEPNSQYRQIPLLDRTSLSSPPPFVTGEEQIKVEGQCARPFAISVGAAFNFRSGKQFGIVPSPPMTGTATAGSQFGVTSTSSVNPYPILMAHVRLTDFGSSHHLGLYGSFGAGPNIRSQASGGTSAEFLAGLSVGIHRRFFITGGADIREQSRLGGGFTIGATVPPNVTTVPVTRSYQAGFGVAFTFAFY